MNPFEMKVDILERDESGALVKTGTKVFKPADRPMNAWVKRPKATEPALPVTSWDVKTAGFIRGDRLAKSALGYLRSCSNDVQQSAAGVLITSGVYSHGLGWSVTPDNFLESMVVMACRKLVKPTWLNNRDEFNIPLLDHPAYPQFALDCVIFALFNGANYSSSLDPVEYTDKKGVTRTFELRNQFCWIDPKTFDKIQGMPPKTVTAALKAKTPFVVDWMKDKQFSPDAQAVLDAATEMFIAGASKRNSADHKYQLHRWDAGWYQVRFGLYGPEIKFQKTPAMEKAEGKFKAAYTAFSDRMRELMYVLDVLPR